MKITEENIFEESGKGNLEVLKSDLVDKVRNKYSDTPLHLLALSGEVEVLKHPSVDKVFECLGRTPLFDLAGTGCLDVLDHPTIDLVHPTIDEDCMAVPGSTPREALINSNKIKRDHLKERYPWYKEKTKDETVSESLKKILNTSQSVRFITET